MQHGFREKQSCERQLSMFQKQNLILSAFSKAFDKMADEKLLQNYIFTTWGRWECGDVGVSTGGGVGGVDDHSKMN